MNVLILACVITWSFGGGFQNSPSYQIVSSPESAAIIVYEDDSVRRQPWNVEPDQKKWILYEVNLEKVTVKTIPIPTIRFTKPDEK